MNIFKILSNGNGSIKEPSISSFLGYLLDPNKEHGLKDYFLKEVIKQIIINKNKWKNFIINENIVDLTNDSRKFRVEIVLEKKVKDNYKKSRFIDIVIKFFHKNELDKPVAIICIENKIYSSSVTLNQLNNQLEGIKKEFNNIPIGFIYLTPTNSFKATEEYNSFVESNPSIETYPLYWKDDSNSNESVFSILVEILELESKGQIEPIFEYSKYTIKSFMNFIDTGFKSYVEEKDQSNSKTRFLRIFREYIKDVYLNLDENERYSIKDIKHKIESLIKKENPNIEKINQGTLSAQLIMHIVNSPTRVHYNVNSNNHEVYDLFYYTDDTKDYLKKYDKKDVEIIPIFKKL